MTYATGKNVSWEQFTKGVSLNVGAVRNDAGTALVDDWELTPLSVDASGNLRSVSVASLVTSSYDYIGATYPTNSSEVYTFKSWWVGGTTVATITVTYTDSTKEVLSSVAKT